ncbi:hypothetical protein [Vibrio proteolyticus]
MAEAISTFTEEQKKLFDAISRKLQREFCIELIKNHFKNQKAAYLSACEKIHRQPSKNPDVSASEMLRNAKVSEFIKSVRETREHADIEDVMGSFHQKRKMLWETVQRCAQNVRPVMNMQGEHQLTDDKDGEIALAYTFDSKGIVSAIAELNKMDGDHAAQRVEIGASDDLVKAILAGRRRTKES